jgi:hypothetical protein
MKNELTKEQREEELAELIERYGEDIVKNVVDEAAKRKAAEDALELLENAEFDLDGALDSYDPTFPRYTPSKDAFEFFILMRLVQGGDFEFDTPIAHYFMVDCLLGYIDDPMMFPYSEEICRTIEIDINALGFMASRGLAKSTVGISFFAVYSAIKGELPNGIGKVWFYLVVAASSKGGARVNALAVKAMCEDSKYLNDYFEEMRFTETESEFIRRCPSGKVGKEAKIPRKDRGFLVRYQGLNTGIRGSRYNGLRVCALIFDDTILNTAAAYSKVMTDNLHTVLHSDAVNSLKGGGKGRVLLLFTPFHYGDVNTRAILTGAFTPVVIPMAKAFDAESSNLKVTDIHSSWEAMHPRVSIMSLIKRAKKAKELRLFLQERMLRLTSGSERLVPDSCIQYCDMKVIENNIDAYNVYITTDFTTTSGEKSDFAGIATWAVSSNEDWFLLNLYLRKMGMDTQYTLTLEEAAKWKRRGKNVEIGVEVDGNQSAHVNALEKEMRTQGVYYSFAKQKGALDSPRKGILSKNSGSGAKHERFRIAVNQFVLPGKMWFPKHLKETPDMEEFVAQIKGATHQAFTRSDDGPDLITQCNLMHVYYPAYEAIAQQVTEDGVYYYQGNAGPTTSAYDSY